jgi:hypothetical protein
MAPAPCSLNGSSGGQAQLQKSGTQQQSQLLQGFESNSAASASPSTSPAAAFSSALARQHRTSSSTRFNKQPASCSFDGSTDLNSLNISKSS